MKKGILSFVVPALIFALTVSAITILPVTGQDTNPIVDKLKELDSKLEGEAPALRNKVNAVIHQVESGALSGALNKLQNDVKKSIIAMVADPEELIRLVDEIIDLTKGATPPAPLNPDFEITTPPYRLDVIQGSFNTTIITIASLNNFSAEVALSAATSAPEVIITLDPPMLIPLPNATATSTLMVNAAETSALGDYMISVTGTSGTLQHSVKISINIIVERKPPMIVSVSRIPRNAPTYNETVKVLANVSDPESEVKEVTLGYSIGAVQQDITMIFNAGLYEATIPAYPFGAVIKYSVHISDNAGNSAVSNSVTYTVEDPYQPLMGDPTWAPQDPTINDSIMVNVTVIEPEGASGVDKVVLQYSNTTGEHSIPMTDNHDGNWTAIIGNQTISKVSFVIKAVDKAGNEIESDTQEFNVTSPAFPLVWILAAITILAAVTGGGAYYVRRKRKKGAATTSVSSAAIKPT